MSTTSGKRFSTHILAGAGMLSALAVILQYNEFSVPIMPSFIKLDFSDLPEIIGAYAYGPMAGIAITLVKNLLHMLVSQSVGVGELSNFLLGAVFSGLTGLIYKRNKTRKTALIAGIAGAVAMAVISFPSNSLLINPLYYTVMGYPEAAILGMYQALLPSVTSVVQALLVFNVPFTLEEVCLHKPDVTRSDLMKSGLRVGQGTPLLDVINLKYVASQLLNTLVGSFGLVTAAPLTALVSVLSRRTADENKMMKAGIADSSGK